MIMDSLVMLALLAAPQASAARAVEPGGGPNVRFTATGTFSDGQTRGMDGYLDRDSDNDGTPDQVVLRVTCSRGAVVSAIVSPRDSASGLPTGKRMHKPFVITKELDRPGGIMANDDWTTRVQGKPQVASWDLATMKGGRQAGSPALSERVLAPANVSAVVCAGS
ncbi:hypothetical protein HMP06_2223 [Sphingomonas sp. HMP6]|nr:hypothetical protein HMP06_2223 [Sphingomonas sp. HMP6]